MNGVINIYKEKGYSSFHVVYMLRRLTGEQKVGHTGTLDPDVTGVLPVCIGKATKLVGQLTDTDKVYQCRMLLGKSTDTQDLSGQVLREMPERNVRETLKQKLAESTKVPADFDGKAYITRVIKSFEGEISQIPPMYSALKVNGAKLVNLARKGVEVDRKPRRVTIHAIDDIQISDDLLHIFFSVHCSRGTYVRTLCEDIGARMGIPACMEELIRTQAAGLDLSSAITLEQAKTFAEAGTLEQHLIPTDRFLDCYPAITVTDDAVKRLIYGNYMMETDIACKSAPQPTDHQTSCTQTLSKKTAEAKVPTLPEVTGNVTEAGASDDLIYRVYDRTGQFYALYRYDKKARCYKCIKMFISAEEAN